MHSKKRKLERENTSESLSSLPKRLCQIKISDHQTKTAILKARRKLNKYHVNDRNRKRTNDQKIFSRTANDNTNQSQSSRQDETIYQNAKNTERAYSNHEEKTLMTGYYFNADLNRYFKIPKPGTPYYKNYLEVVAKNNNRSPKPVSNHTNLEIVAKPKISANFFHTMANREIVSTPLRIRSLCELNVKRLTKCTTFATQTNGTECNDLQINPSASLLIAGMKNGAITLQEILSTGKNRLTLASRALVIENSPVTSLRWSKDTTLPLLCGSLLGGVTSGQLKLFDCELNERFSMRLRYGSLWCAEWAPNNEYLSLGVSQGALLLHIETNRMSPCWTKRSDVFAQTFNSTGQLLLNGSRDGCIRTIDTRIPLSKATGGSHARILRHHSPICCLRFLLSDENYILANSMNGNIQRWDRRLSKCVQIWKCQNDAELLKFTVDRNEEYVIAGGKDNFLTIWSLKTGDVVQKIGALPQRVVTSVFEHMWCNNTIFQPALFFVNEDRFVYFDGMGTT
jgi:WD40 repeat protein